MKTRILILTLALVAGIAHAETYSIVTTPEQQAGLEYAVEIANEKAKADHDATFAADATPEYKAAHQYQPITAAAYLKFRVAEILSSYGEARKQAVLNDPANQQFLQGLLSRTPDEIEKAKAAVEKALRE